MYLAKFFHRPPGDSDRKLLFIPGGSPVIIGIHMHAPGEPEKEDFLREEFSDIGAAVGVFRRHAENCSPQAMSRPRIPSTRCAICCPIRNQSPTGKRAST